MFEKSLYDLIRGLRNHKGNEKEYIQKSLKECRAEVRGQDMDLKATALLKLIYLEMVGHDMSWASFHVLEVMSSPKYHQKRVGYLGAVQSFRPDTEVLMLATNLLKKDLGSTTPTVISLPVATLPHVITPSLALSTLADLLPRLSHSHSNIRKKTLVTLYRLALVYPEALRAAWPKIKERLMDPDEDPSVTAAIVNVVCELGWRRPHDFLPLAPRLFELLVDGGNNWMAIKLIKLFATLTPLEPRLVRKLLPPLTNIIRTTPAMSLLYECINGIIQGGILGNADDVTGTDEIATLCVNKLRGMIMIDGDPNLKYVALLAFNKIVITHPYLVSQQEDVILECIDSPDITIRIQALDLVQGMVTGDNLMSIVSRLMKQLKTSMPVRDRQQTGTPMDPSDSDTDSSFAESGVKSPGQTPPLPDDYRIDVIARILAMCAKDNYSSVLDFDWYIDVLTQLVRMAPISRKIDADAGISSKSRADVSEKIGDELRSIAVKVRAMRPAAVRASEDILNQLNADTPPGYSITSGALKSVAWIMGEYAPQLPIPDDNLNSLLQLIPRATNSEVITTTLQAVTKIFATIVGDEMEQWTAERKSRVSLLMARIIHVFEPLQLNPSLEVQERAVEFTELLKLTSEAASGQPATTDDVEQDPPLLLTQAIPSLFNGWELNSVAKGAQHNVPVPDGLDLDEPIHANLARLLSEADSVALAADDSDEFEVYYHQRPPPTSIDSSAPAISRLTEPAEDYVGSYQQATEDSYLDADIVARRKAERQERNKDDPFYIPSRTATPQTSTPIHNILHTSNGPDLDIDSIPIMQLDLDKVGSAAAPQQPQQPKQHQRPQQRPRQKVVIAADETLEGSDSGSGRRTYDSENNSDSFTKTKARKLKQSLLKVDSSSIRTFNLEDQPAGGFDHERQQQEEAEMQKAMKEVERLRLEMQRANERIHVAQGVDVEGTVVKKKKTKKVKKPLDADEGAEVKPKKTKKKKARIVTLDEPGDDSSARGVDPPVGGASAEVVIAKKKKKRPVAQIQEAD
ncbi:adaptin N terminal region-domain-containing protein [Ilyonectria robusta]|uniref:adaptin N terminal region-domain-containing protein n=1 Tax=Ilyonectria robusta TaxID=1079257 RepID=UPI001E8D15F8|nr:adaptin N terminal region-domain-containing protein [Ilyonectria robusta]KAH8733291.1 adaptin N terminal region-domain-containing protein [Ilyonectria robusta]